MLFTLDKLVSKTVKQLQVVHSDEVGSRLVELWRYENARGVEVRDGAAGTAGWGAVVGGGGMVGRRGAYGCKSSDSRGQGMEGRWLFLAVQGR